MKKQKKWIKKRHKIIRDIAFFIVYPYSKIKFGIDIIPFKDTQKRQYIILLNHQTVFDQFFVGMAVKGPIYYVATEDIFSNGFVSSLIRFAVEPIPIKKQTTDLRAVMNCIKVAKEGGTIAIAPEGNRTYSGKTEYMNPAIAPLVKKLGLPILLFRIEGGYGVQPRWTDKVRRGKMKAYVSKVIEPEQLKEFSDDQLYDIIQKELYVNEAYSDAIFKSNRKAEYLERAIYVCPHCGLSQFESSGDIIRCKKCSLTVKYLENKKLECQDKEFKFEFVNDWYEYQKGYVNNLELTEFEEKPIYTENVQLSEVIVYKKKNLLEKSTQISLYGDKITISQNEYKFCDITAISVLGRNKLNIYINDKIYQIKGDKRFCALKYVNIYYRYKNIVKGDKNVEFLGL